MSPRLALAWLVLATGCAATAPSSSSLAAFTGCAVDATTDTVYAFAYDTAAAGLSRWRACTDDERALWMDASGNACSAGP